MSNKKLFSEFPPVSTEKWEEVIIKDLKGADYDKKLIWRTIEGINVRPYYRAEDLKPLGQATKAKPGEYPFTRGTKSQNNWLVRQQFCACKDPKKTNAQLLDTLMKGVDSIGLSVSKDISDAELAQLLQGIYLDAVEINFTDCLATPVELIGKLDALVRKANVAPDKVCGSVEYDPLKELNLKGSINDDEAFAKAKATIDAAKGLPRLRTVGVSGATIHNAGASVVQELAMALAMGNEYMRRLTDLGLSADEAGHRIKFTFAVGANYFFEIAKFRAARLLWANIVNAYGPAKTCSARMKAHAVTSAWNQTAYDAYVNLLRGTTEAMSAAIAGVDSIEVLPFDTPYSKPSDFSNRIARNTQILLKEEAHFDQVMDPSAGSYYIETLTMSIAQEAWNLFKQIEDKGGYIAAFRSGWIQEQIKATATKRDKNIATRREILLGTNQYPNFTERLTPAQIEGLQQREACCTCSASLSNPQAEPLRPYRGAEAFEALRIKTDAAGKAPKAFMLTFGNLAMCRARAQFSCNFFAVAGFEVVDNTRFATIEEGVQAALAAKANLVVACSSDDEYAEAVPRIHQLLGNKATIVVAGDPACKEALQAQGIEHFISVKNNVLDTLRQYQGRL